MRKILVTGFKTFLGLPVNSSWEVAQRLPSVIGDFYVYTKLISVSFELAEKEVISNANIVHPNIILCLGQASKRLVITPEYVAINLRYSTVPDNNGFEPHGEPVIPGGPSAYFSTLPVRKMVKAMADVGTPAEVSYSAGTYVCNDLMYKLLHRYKDTDIKVGFIHIPFIYGQDNPKERLNINDAVKAIKASISIL